MFRASIETITGEPRAVFDDLIAWAERLAEQSNVRLFSYKGVEMNTLLPRIIPANAGLVTIANDRQRPSLWLYRSVFERHAPKSIERVEGAIAPLKIGQGNTVWEITPEVINALTAAYQETLGDLPA